jgi:predicted flap endonuclease-1-like 5' DNA nuclease
MPAFTTNQWAILFLVLLLGWLLGLVSRQGGAKWRRAYEAERDARIEEQRDHAATLDAANARIAELERARVAAPAAVAATATPARPVTTPDTLDLRKDDLSRIRGIGAAGERRLNSEGIHRYSDITSLSPAEETALEERMGADPGYIEQERWREQAALLAEGKIDEHRARFG